MTHSVSMSVLPTTQAKSFTVGQRSPHDSSLSMGIGIGHPED